MLIESASKRMLRTGVILSLLVMCPVNASATEYSFKSSLDGTVRVNDNIRMVPNNTEQATTTRILLAAEAAASDALWASSMNARIGANTYSNEISDTVEQRLEANGVIGVERSQMSLSASYDVMSTLDFESNEIGLVPFQVDKETISVSPGYSYSLSERTSLSTSISFIDVGYSDTVSTGFIPYELFSPSISLGFQVSELTTLNASIAFTDYERDDGLTGYETKMLRFMAAHSLTEYLEANISLGISKRTVVTETRTAPINILGTLVQQSVDIVTETDGVVYGLTVDHDVYEGGISYTLSRSESSSSFGTLDQITLASIDFSSALSDTIVYNIDASVSRIENIGGTTLSSDRDVLRLKAGANYAISKGVTMSLSYSYVTREYLEQRTDESPESNTLYLSLKYRFDELSTY